MQDSSLLFPSKRLVSKMDRGLLQDDSVVGWVVLKWDSIRAVVVRLRWCYVTTRQPKIKVGSEERQTPEQQMQGPSRIGFRCLYQMHVSRGISVGHRSVAVEQRIQMMSSRTCVGIIARSFVFLVAFADA